MPRLLRKRGVAHALVLRTDGVSPSAVGDDEVGGYLAVRHLIDLGHRDIAVATGPSFTSSGVGRLAGARRALDEAGINPPQEWLIAAGYGIENGFTAGESLLDQEAVKRPTAVFAANDNIALGIIAAAHHFGITVGRDLALVGYNDTPLSARLSTPCPQSGCPSPRSPAPPSISSSTRARNHTSGIHAHPYPQGIQRRPKARMSRTSTKPG
ncbi:HTH-type transcriptional repressor PurR [Arthrobacter sp. Hiyo8]|nr:HTH-type transcriptional repressor PurR [Arthrobacter sp. Hiyo8]